MEEMKNGKDKLDFFFKVVLLIARTFLEVQIHGYTLLIFRAAGALVWMTNLYKPRPYLYLF